MRKISSTVVLGTSLFINLVICFPCIILFVKSQSLQLVVYQDILAKRFCEPKIVFIGDSLTREGVWWGWRIGEYNFDVWNYGVAEADTQDILKQARKVSTLETVKYVFIMAGINDIRQPDYNAEKTFSNYKEIIDTLLTAGQKPVVQLTLYRKNEPDLQFIDSLNKKLRGYAEAKGCLVIDLNPVLAPSNSLLDKYTYDGLHLTSKAYKVWANKVKLTCRNERN